jgi:hypothetical protein
VLVSLVTPSVPKCLSLENRVSLTDTFLGRQTKRDRVVCRNDLVFFKKETYFFSFIGYLLDYILAPYLGCPTEANFTRFGCSGISTIGAGGQGVFYPGTWVTV